MKINKKRIARWKTTRPLAESEMHASANPVFIEALAFCLAVIDGEKPELTLSMAHEYIVEIEDRVNFLIYNTTDILKTNALMECADIIRESAEDLHIDFRLEEGSNES